MLWMFLIVGGDSEIGAAAYRAIKAQGLAVAATTRRRDRIAPDRSLLDLAAPLDAWEPPQGTSAVCICAAIARLADCAADPEATARINVTQTSALIDKLLARGIYVLFLSTNQVFDGRVPHVRPDAAYSPVSEYGRQKARTEAALRVRMARGAPAAILRLAKVVSGGMPLLEGWIADLAASKPIRAFSDMSMAPTPTDLVSAAIKSLLDDRASGIFQLTGPRDVAYVDVGRFLAAHIGAEPSLVVAMSARAAGLPEGATPLNTTLESGLLRDRYGLEAPDVWQVIAGVISARAPT
jgi:dTDP-4-dehydrorhamnose reductase